MKKLTQQFWTLVVVCIIFGVFIGKMDTSPNWDDTGITVGAILFITFLTGAILKEYAWLWALIVGGCVFGFNLVLRNSYASAIAVVIAFAGAYMGVVFRKMVS